MVEYLNQLYAKFIEFLTAILQPILDPIALILQYPGEMFRQLILAIPLSGAKAIFLAYPIILILWVMMFKKEEVQGKLHLCGNWTIDIRPVVLIALLGQVIIYYIF